jgi:hypothetical protein
MEKKRDDILLPLGFNAMSIAGLAYSMKIKEEIKKEIEDTLREILEDHRKNTEKMLLEFRTSLLGEIRDELKRHDTGWTKL